MLERPTNRPTDRPGHRVVSLPILMKPWTVRREIGGQNTGRKGGRKEE